MREAFATYDAWWRKIYQLGYTRSIDSRMPRMRRGSTPRQVQVSRYTTRDFRIYQLAKLIGASVGLSPHKASQGIPCSAKNAFT